MSRIGTKPITIEKDVTVTLKDGEVLVKGPQGELTRQLPTTVKVSVEGDTITVERIGESKQAKSDHGTIRAHLANMIEGVKNGFKKELELVGMGYRAAMEGTTLVLTVGWTHPVKVEAPEGVTFEVEDSVFVVVKGADKEQVGLWAAKIRSVRKPEPYKGKGIRYKDEVVRRKTSKTMSTEE